ncbi:MAG: MerR family transcriptional regulator [Planctomycetota bacterium]|nr:MerR family transcriptional regulator [Planctomycetota bacterium]
MPTSVPERVFDIAELAAAAGVSARTIRYYGELGLLDVEARGPGGRRRYGADALERLRFIARLKQLGMTLEEIGALNDAFARGRTPAMLDRLLPLLETRLLQVDERLSELKTLRSDLTSYRDRIRSKRAS